MLVGALVPREPAPPGMSRGPPMRIRCRVQLVFVYVLRLASSSRQLHGNAPRARRAGGVASGASAISPHVAAGSDLRSHHRTLSPPPPYAY